MRYIVTEKSGAGLAGSVIAKAFVLAKAFAGYRAQKPS
jgi:hypothetical protein